ncbi:MAG: excinuclease ABC subunit UvrC [Rhodobacteraceae bacterium]|nr:excinuclease ABC subunit UvrC [Paracoccaceae bacterium]
MMDLAATTTLGKNEAGEERSATSGLQGTDCIRHYADLLDGSPGVYRMLGSKGEVLYVGKAKNLRNRVRSYANRAGLNARLRKMIDATTSMMVLTTRTETEALLLEQNLIKQLKPAFNVLLRDDKSFPGIHIASHQKFPPIRKHRGKRIDKGDYFGPFASAAAVNRTLGQLQKVFLLRSCPDSVFNNRSRPCLQYQIKRCSAPCVGNISAVDYAQLVADAKEFLLGRSGRIQAQLATQMKEASDALEFERAAALRDRIHALTQVQLVQGINPRTVSDCDVVGLHLEGGLVCVQVFFIRGNRNWGNRAYFPKNGADAGEDDVLEAFLAQFYSTKTPPPLLLVSHPPAEPDMLEAVLTDRRGKRVRIRIPKRGEKAVLVENAVRNARESLALKMAEVKSQARLMAKVATVLRLDEVPQRLEVFDNSHLQGTDPVGAMIAVGTEGFLKSGYRKFNIKRTDTSPGDDFAMVNEVITRRFRRLVEEDSERESGAWPDAILIDGGKGQVSAAVAAMNELGIADLPIMGIAKGRERNQGREQFHFPDGSVVALRRNDPVLYFIQRVRDEAHRFAIGVHRTRRAKRTTASALSRIPGIGPTRKSALLAHFGSAKAVEGAGIEDLKKVRGISAKMAETIHAHLHDN